MSSVKGDGVGNIESVEIGAAKKTTFDHGDAFFGFGERGGGSVAGRTTANYNVLKIIFTHLYIILSRFR